MAEPKTSNIIIANSSKRFTISKLKWPWLKDWVFFLAVSLLFDSAFFLYYYYTNKTFETSHFVSFSIFAFAVYYFLTKEWLQTITCTIKRLDAEYQFTNGESFNRGASKKLLHEFLKETSNTCGHLYLRAGENNYLLIHTATENEATEIKAALEVFFAQPLTIEKKTINV